MSNVNRSATVQYTPAQMYALVNDVEHYPQFLPWCSDTKVESRREREVRASIELARGGLRKRFTTLNTLDPDRAINITLVSGPFRKLNGHWRFEPLGEAGCRVTLDMSFEFSSSLLGMMLGPIFYEISNSLVSAFTRRAREVYGD